MAQRPYWNQEMETIPHQRLKKLEADLLSKQLHYVYQTSPFYKEAFDRTGAIPAS